MQCQIAYTVKDSTGFSDTRVAKYNPENERHACLYGGKTPDGRFLEYCVYHSAGPSQKGNLFDSPSEFAFWNENGDCFDTCYLSGETSRLKLLDEKKAFLQRVSQEEKRFSDFEKDFIDLPLYLEKRALILREIRRIKELIVGARIDHFRQERATLSQKKAELELVDSDIRSNYLVPYQTAQKKLGLLEKLNLGRVVLLPGDNSASVKLIEEIIAEYRKKIGLLSVFFPQEKPKEEKKAVFKSLPTLTIDHIGEIRVDQF